MKTAYLKISMSSCGSLRKNLDVFFDDSHKTMTKGYFYIFSKIFSFMLKNLKKALYIELENSNERTKNEKMLFSFGFGVGCIRRFGDAR